MRMKKLIYAILGFIIGFCFHFGLDEWVGYGDIDWWQLWYNISYDPLLTGVILMVGQWVAVYIYAKFKNK